MYVNSYIVGKIVGKSWKKLFHFIVFHFHREKRFEGTAFLGGTSPNLTTNLFNIKEPLSLLLKMKLAEKIHAFQIKLK